MDEGAKVFEFCSKGCKAIIRVNVKFLTLRGGVVDIVKILDK